MSYERVRSFLWRLLLWCVLLAALVAALACGVAWQLRPYRGCRAAGGGAWVCASQLRGAP